MAAISDDELLVKVKEGMAITGNHLDATIKIFIEDVKHYLESAGLPKNKINDTESVGVIVRGVIDLYNYGSGNAKLSDYFYQRASQLIQSQNKESEV